MAELSDVDSTARAVHLSKYFIYRLAQRGEIPCYRTGRALRFDVDEVRAWMRSKAKKNE